MRIGILNGISGDEEEELNTREIDSFRAFLGTPAGDTLTLVEYRLTEGEFPASVDECDAYLLTGSSKGVYDGEDWIPRLAVFVQEAYANQQKLVGICFGHQMLANSLGGKAVKSDRGWGFGRREVQIIQTRPWMTPPLAKAPLYFAHQDQVVELPQNAERLGQDPFCPNDIFVIGNQVLGIQGHPEFTTQFMEALVEVMEPEVGPELAGSAASSIADGPTASPVVANWILNFLREPSEPAPAPASNP